MSLVPEGTLQASHQATARQQGRMNRRGKELKFQRRKPSAGICLLESTRLHVFLFFRSLNNYQGKFA